MLVVFFKIVLFSIFSIFFSRYIFELGENGKQSWKFRNLCRQEIFPTMTSSLWTSIFFFIKYWPIRARVRVQLRYIWLFTEAYKFFASDFTCGSFLFVESSTAPVNFRLFAIFQSWRSTPRDIHTTQLTGQAKQNILLSRFVERKYLLI